MKTCLVNFLVNKVIKKSPKHMFLSFFLPNEVVAGENSVKEDLA